MRLIYSFNTYNNAVESRMHSKQPNGCSGERDWWKMHWWMLMNQNTTTTCQHERPNMSTTGLDVMLQSDISLRFSWVLVDCAWTDPCTSTLYLLYEWLQCDDTQHLPHASRCILYVDWRVFTIGVRSTRMFHDLVACCMFLVVLHVVKATHKISAAVRYLLMTLGVMQSPNQY